MKSVSSTTQNILPTLGLDNARLGRALFKKGRLRQTTKYTSRIMSYARDALTGKLKRQCMLQDISYGNAS